jgi:hypothetical protein
VPDVPALTALLRDFLNANKDVHGKPMSLRAAALKSGDVNRRQTFSDIYRGKHSGNISEDTVEALMALGIPERAIRRAANQQVESGLGPFHLPKEANRLSPSQRDAVLSVVNAILNASERPAERPERALTAVASGTTKGRRSAQETARRVRSGEEPQR